MRKIALLATAITLSFAVNAQKIDIGIMVAPNVSFNRLIEEDEVWDIQKNGAALKFNAGLVVDVFFKDNIALTTGLTFTTKRSALTADSSSTTILSTKVDLQYLRIPIGFKFYTNEIANRMQLYFQLMGNLDAKIAEKIQDNDGQFDNDFAKLVDAGVLVGAGLEMGIGQSNKVFAGLNYDRGLINILTNDFHPDVNKKLVKINNDLVSLVVGFKF